jgi:FKBP-type peptidyl-prolyl cis-trans isomerase
MTETLRGRLALAILTCTTALGVALPAQGETKKQDPNPTIPADKIVVKHDSGLVYSILEPGTGRLKPDAGDSAKIHFTEWLSDGTFIHSTAATGPVTVDVGSTRGIFAVNFAPTFLGKGGKIKMTAPPKFAYGAAGQKGRIPPNSTMIFEIELVEFTYRPKRMDFAPGDPNNTKVTKSGLKYEIYEVGEGTSPGVEDVVEIEYTAWTVKGRLLSATSQLGHTMKAPIKSLSHPFFKEAIPMMKTGAVWRILVPVDQTVRMHEDSVWQIKLIDHNKAAKFPPGNEKVSTSTKSGLLYERLAEGKGEHPGKSYRCELKWDFWKTDGTYIAGTDVAGIMPVIVGRAEHKFLDEILLLMKIGDVMRIEVPDTMTPPRMLRFKTIWRIELMSMKKPLPAPKFHLPKDSELTTTKSGLKYKVIARGDGKGATPRMGGMVEVHYSGWIDDGKLFDSSFERGQSAEFRIGEVIPGWNEGLQLMKPGDSFLFVIPGALGYGPKGTPDGKIGPDATLVFHVKLLGLK